MNYFYPEFRKALDIDEEDILFLGNGSTGQDNHDNAIVGLTENEYDDEYATVVVYDRNRILDNLIEDGMDEEDAREHMAYNVEGSLGLKYPVFINGIGHAQHLKHS